MKKLSFKMSLILIIWTSVNVICANAYDFEVDGIYYKIDYKDASKCGVTFNNASQGTYSGNITIPSSVSYKGKMYHVTSINDGAFRDCHSLYSIKLPDCITNIGYSSFQECRSLINIELPKSLKTMGTSAFYGCNNLETILIHDGIEILEGMTFLNCKKLKSITLPKTIKSIVWGNIPYGYDPFMGCDSLKEINVAEGNKYFSSENGVLMNYDKTELLRCPGGFSGDYIIPSNINKLNIFAFRQCKQLTSIDFSKSKIKCISDYAFDYCFNLRTIQWPDKLETIGQNAFYGAHLEDITIPASVSEIRASAFSSTDLISVEVLNPTPAICSPTAFQFNEMKNCVLFVPNGAYDKYRNADGWNTFTYITDRSSNHPVYMGEVNVVTPNVGVYVGEQYNMSYNYYPQKATNTEVVWESLTPEIFTVDQKGVLTGVSAGIGQVKCSPKYGQGQSSITSVVIWNVPVASIEVTPTEVYLEEGESAIINVSIQPTNATNAKVTYSSSNPSVAIANEGKVYAFKEGVTIITVSAGSVSAQIVVIVNKSNNIKTIQEESSQYVIYSTNGKANNTLTKGLNIVKSATGAAKKIFIK